MVFLFLYLQERARRGCHAEIQVVVHIRVSIDIPLKKIARGRGRRRFVCSGKSGFEKVRKPILSKPRKWRLRSTRARRRLRAPSSPLVAIFHCRLVNISSRGAPSVLHNPRANVSPITISLPKISSTLSHCWRSVIR